MKHLKLYEEHINEIGDASAKPFKVKGPSPKGVLKDMIRAQGDRTSDDGWFDDDEKSVWTFSGDKGTDYEIEIAWNTKMKMGRPRRLMKNPKAYRKWEFRMNISFYAIPVPVDGTEFNIDDEDDRERTTNLGEQYRVLATVVDTVIPVINEVTKDFSIDTIYILPKADEGEPESIHNKRGKFYLAYLKKQIKKIRDKVTVTANKYIGGFLIRGGHISGSGGGDIGYIRNESTVHVKLFEDFYGDNLWSDQTYPQRAYNMGGHDDEMRFFDYISKMYNSNEFEKNTRQEDKLLNAIEDYLSTGNRGNMRSATPLLKKLLPYKQLYPEMLDPGQSLQPFDSLFRGMTMEWAEVNDMIDKCKKIINLKGLYKNVTGRKFIILKGVRKKIKSRTDTGFISTSTSLRTSASFVQMDAGRWPIVAAANFGKIEKKSIMNPDFLNMLNPMDESEVWVLGNELEAIDVYLPVFDPETYKSTRMSKENSPYRELMNRIWGIYNDNRTKKK